MNETPENHDECVDLEVAELSLGEKASEEGHQMVVQEAEGCDREINNETLSEDGVSRNDEEEAHQSQEDEILPENVADNTSSQKDVVLHLVMSSKCN